MGVLFAAVFFMLAVGGSVMCGKFMGENDHEAASAIFSKILYAVLTVSGLIVAVSLYFLDEVVALLGANEDLHGMVRDYMQIILWASPLLIIGLTLDYFVRVDGRPVLASFALVMFAASRMSISPGGNWTMITSTLAMMPTGRIRSRIREKGSAALPRGNAPEAIRFSNAPWLTEWD